MALLPACSDPEACNVAGCSEGRAAIVRWLRLFAAGFGCLAEVILAGETLAAATATRTLRGGWQS
ncbi:hypothetical protein [Erwinia sp.]|uniref:hypothetical protein n=1 Tax=Erwinia citreus TaxID=558 RepID=UPI00289F9207|nr:hypothetical protein [Erwinia sp.]